MLFRLALTAAVRRFDNDDETTMRILSVWVLEFIKLLGRRQLHPLNAECPFCHQMVRLHYNKAGRRHLFAHARAYSGTHYTAKIKCVGSGMLATFDPRPNESQQFKLPKSLELEGSIIGHCNECRFQPSMAATIAAWQNWFLRMSFSNTPVVLPWPDWLGTCHTGASGSW